MAAFDAPKGVGARRVSRSIMSSGPGGTNYQNFDPFEAADAGQSNFRLTSQDDDELEVTIPGGQRRGQEGRRRAVHGALFKRHGQGRDADRLAAQGPHLPRRVQLVLRHGERHARALILSLGKRDSEMWSKLLAQGRRRRRR